jgi:hypothetical protein
MSKFNVMKEKPLFDLEGMIQNWLNQLVVSNKNLFAGAVARQISGEGSLKLKRTQLDARAHPTVDETMLKRYRDLRLKPR